MRHLLLPSPHHFVRLCLLLTSASLLIITSSLHAATSGGKPSGDALPPSVASKTTTSKTSDPAWLMVMMMTRPKVRAAVLSAKPTGAPFGWAPAAVPKRLGRCRNQPAANKISPKTSTAASTKTTFSILNLKKSPKKTRLALLARSPAVVPASDRGSLAARKKQLKAMVTAASKQLNYGAPTPTKSGIKSAPKLMKPTAWQPKK